MSDTMATGTDTRGVQDRASEAAGAAREHANQVAGTAKEQVSEVAGTAKEQARAVATDAKHEARKLVDTGRQQLRDEAGQQAERAVSSLRDLGEQLQRMATGQGQPEGPVADFARQAADRVQRLAGTIETKRPEELLDDVKRFARQRPGLFVLGALGAGFVAGRVLRSVDTSAIADAAKNGTTGGAEPSASRPEMISGPGALGAPAAGTEDAGDALAAGMAGTTPADLVDPPTSAIPTAPHPLPSEPLQAPDTGAER